MRKVVMVIVIWNGKDDTLECLQSLRGDPCPNKEIVVVDNGSTDDSVAAIRSQYPEVTILQTGRNLGFTGGNNTGIQYALSQGGADYVYLLNNDTTVEPNATGELLCAAELHPNCGLLVPVMHYFDPPREIWFAGSTIDMVRGVAFHDNSRQPDRHHPPYDVPWATGCAMFLRADVLAQLGGFDDRYYLTWEDVDLSLRVRAAGYRVVAVPSARIYHKGGRSGDKMHESKYYYTVRNKLLLVHKHHGTLGYVRAAAHIITSSLWRCLQAYRRERGEFRRYVRSVTFAVRDHLAGRYGAYRTK
jgi:GT2 family glycosyltransferase